MHKSSRRRERCGGVKRIGSSLFYLDEYAVMTLESGHHVPSPGADGGAKRGEGLFANVMILSDDDRLREFWQRSPSGLGGFLPAQTQILVCCRAKRTKGDLNPDNKQVYFFYMTKKLCAIKKRPGVHLYSIKNIGRPRILGWFAGVFQEGVPPFF